MDFLSFFLLKSTRLVLGLGVMIKSTMHFHGLLEDWPILLKINLCLVAQQQLAV